MRHALTPALRQFLNDALLQGPFAPASAQVGRGGFDPVTKLPKPNQAALYEPAADLPVTFSLTQEESEIVIYMALPQADEYTEFSEFAIFSANGTCLMHATMTPQVLAAGVEAGFKFVFLPEVTA